MGRYCDPSGKHYVIDILQVNQTPTYLDGLSIILAPTVFPALISLPQECRQTKHCA